jgi:hypothetical protein
MFGRKTSNWVRQKLRVIYFGDPEWGFTDAAVPKLRSLIEPCDFPANIWHNGLTIEVRGDESREKFQRMVALFENARLLPEFERCRIGVSEGDSQSYVDDLRITAQAIANGEKA